MSSWTSHTQGEAERYRNLYFSKYHTTCPLDDHDVHRCVVENERVVYATLAAMHVMVEEGNG